MIVAGMVLIAVGAVDIVRQFVHPSFRRFVLGGVGILILLVGVLSAAWLPALLAIAIAAAWIWLFPLGERARASFWPAIALAIVCAVFVAVLGPRSDAGVIGGSWRLATPLGELTFDHALLLIGALFIVLESGNVIVRAALMSEMPMAMSATPLENAAESARPTLKGGRLIGPLERIVVFALTLAGIYSLLAAVLAAKGIVRFPEISRDGDSGDRAEYFLIGSLVSWVVALVAAFLVWWGIIGIS